MPSFEISPPVRQTAVPFGRNPFFLLIVSIAAGSVASNAGAQDPAATTAGAPPSTAVDAKVPSSAASAPSTLESVTITANRRREPAREVPMQVSAIPTDQLEKAGAKTLSDYLVNIPGVDVRTAGGDGTGAVSIRGVTTGQQTIATVGTYVDDVATGSSSAFAAGNVMQLDMALLDLNHIEVLRGPQGTLYGAGAMGGLLKYVTNEPNTYEFSGKVMLGANVTRGGTAGGTLSAVVNVPLKEDVAGFRVAVFRDRAGGYVDAVGAAAEKNVNGGATTGARISLLIEPSYKLKIRLTDTAQEIRRDGGTFVDYDATTGQPLNGMPARGLSLREPYITKMNIAAADIEYDFGWARMNSITSSQISRLKQTTDVTNPYAPLLSSPEQPISTVGQFQRAGVQKQTQEIRFTSPGKGEFEWLGGLFYDHEVGTNDQVVYSGLTAGGAGPDFLTASLPTVYREVALYGDVTWNIAPKFQITGGMRLARNKQSFRQIGDGLLLGGAADVSSGSAETSKTYLATARYALTPTSNIYFRAASGYRPGGPNANIRDPETGALLIPPTFQSDTLWSYEGGYKADLLDKKLSLEAALFAIRWSGIQQTFAVNGVTAIVNGGRAAIDGLEFSAAYRPSRKLSLVGNFAYSHARLTEDAPGLAVAGARLPNSPNFSGSFSVNQEFDLAGYAAYVGLTERLIGKRNAGFDGSGTLPNYRIPGYAITDIQAGVTIDRFQLALYVRNVLDKRAQVGAETSLVPAGGPVLVTESRPRTVGFTLTTQF